ncbi:hypothetical protein ACFWGM_27440 [Streptomyces roseolus]|uniref:hypothetical protein n=1 Tax=Streptomyces roseolus TaxID=67358 RepID=UPI003653D60D
MRPQDGAAATSMLPPVNSDDGGYGYDDRPGRQVGLQPQPHRQDALESYRQ